MWSDREGECGAKMRENVVTVTARQIKKMAISTKTPFRPKLQDICIIFTWVTISATKFTV